MINKHKSNKIKENSNTVRHLNNGTDHRHSKSCCDQSSPARRTINQEGNGDSMGHVMLFNVHEISSMYHGRFVRYIYLDRGWLLRQHVSFQLATVGYMGKTATVRIIFRYDEIYSQPNVRYIFYMQYFFRGMNDIIRNRSVSLLLHKNGVLFHMWANGG